MLREVWAVLSVVLGVFSCRESKLVELRVVFESGCCECVVVYVYMLYMYKWMMHVELGFSLVKHIKSGLEK